MLSAVSNAVIRALLAPCCAACDRPLDDPLSGAICGACWRDWPRLTPPMCERCGDQLPVDRARGHRRDDWCSRCQDGRTSISRIRSAGMYDGALRHMIHALKYRKRRMIAPLLADRIRAECEDAFIDIDAVIPVPLHWRRRLDRGFNQADDLAVHLAERLRLPVWHALRRRRAGPPQASLSAARRHTNTRRAYAMARLERWRGGVDRPRLAGANVLLVDDVVTTGATLEACAQVLLDAGAGRVAAVTAARAVAERPLRPPPGPRLSLVPRR